MSEKFPPFWWVVLGAGICLVLFSAALFLMKQVGPIAGKPANVRAAAALGAFLALLVALGFLVWGLELRRLHTERSWTPDTESNCPNCGDDDIVRGPRKLLWSFVARHTARCLTCGHRSLVRESHWLKLRLPEAGDPFESGADRHLLLNSHPTIRSMALSLGCMAVVSAASGYFSPAIARALHMPYPVIRMTTMACGVFLMLVVLHRFALPKRRPGRRCVHCGYDLRNCAEARCSECGEPFDPALVNRRVPVSAPSAAESAGHRDAASQ